MSQPFIIIDVNGRLLSEGDIVAIVDGDQEGLVAYVRHLIRQPDSGEPRALIGFSYDRIADDTLRWISPIRLVKNGVQNPDLVRRQESRMFPPPPPAPAAPFDITPDQLRTSLRGWQCPACGKDKQRAKSFCYGCYRKLPKQIQNDLYKLLGDGYEGAFAQALAALNVKSPHL